MRRTSICGMLTALALSLLLIPTVAAQHPCPLAPAGGGAALGLSEGQQQAIERIRERGRTEQAGIRKEIMRLRHELQGEMMQDRPDERAVAGLIEQMGEARTRMQKLHVGMRLAMRNELTPQQRDEAALHGFGMGGRDGGMGCGACCLDGGHGGHGCGGGMAAQGCGPRGMRKGMGPCGHGGAPGAAAGICDGTGPHGPRNTMPPGQAPEGRPRERRPRR